MNEEKIKDPNNLKNQKKDKYIIINKNEKVESSLSIKKIIDNSFPVSLSKNVGKMLESLTPSIELVTRNAQQISKIRDSVEKVVASLKPVVNQISKSIDNITPYFSELAKTLSELLKDPDSVFNWISFSKSLSNYFWLPPYLMDSSQLMKILKRVNSEEEMDKELEKYFTDEIIIKLLNEIITKSLKKHREIMIQIKASYKNENYALVNTGLFSVIDSLCSFFVENKRENTYRINLFEPILKIEKKESYDYYNILILSMINNNINFLYGGKKNTHKIARRHPSQHGEFFSNNKIDTIMLLHTVYYLLTITSVYKKYEKSLKLEQYYVGKNKILRYKINKEKQ